MKNINKIAKSFYKSLNGEVNFLNVKHYCEKVGYKVLLYGNNTSANAVINSLGLVIPEHRIGTIYVNTNHKYIFINDKADEFARLEALLHEVGHILLEHINSMLRIEVQECEANEFSLCVLKLKEQNNKFKVPKTPIAILLVAVLGICFICAIQPKTMPGTATYTTAISQNQPVEQPPQSEDAPALQSEPLPVASDETVYVTQTGECYHKHDCHTIRNSTIFELPLSEVQSTYRPCKICIR